MVIQTTIVLTGPEFLGAAFNNSPTLTLTLTLYSRSHASLRKYTSKPEENIGATGSNNTPDSRMPSGAVTDRGLSEDLVLQDSSDLTGL